VLAYANGLGGERLLAVYNHSERSVRGRIRAAVLRIDGRRENEGSPAARLSSAPLTEALALDPTRQRHVLHDRLGGAERAVDYRGLIEDGLDLELAPNEFLLLAPAAALPAS
jgi:hypothetical protein